MPRGGGNLGGVERRPCPPQADCPKGKAGAERLQDARVASSTSVRGVAFRRRQAIQGAVRALVIVEAKIPRESGMRCVAVGLLA